MKQNIEKYHKLGMIARKIVENGKGILAADESPTSIGIRFSRHNIENTAENRRKYRQIMLGADIQTRLGGIIFHEETFEQKTDSGRLFVDVILEQGISPGIKLDKGLIDFKSREKVSVGLEDLAKKLKKEIYRKAEFAKWRSVFGITSTAPTEDCIHENCSVLAKYAVICQRYGIVPIVEPELLWEGKHSINECEQITKTILGCLVYHLNLHNVYIPGILIKPAFVTPGKDSLHEIDYKDVAQRTFNCLMSTIPTGMPGIVFLSGGHNEKDSTMFLDRINKETGLRTWKLSFSYGRALTDPILKAWNGNDKNIKEAIRIFEERLDDTFRAAQGKYLDSKK